jgi:hypothetical protein
MEINSIIVLYIYIKKKSIYNILKNYPTLLEKAKLNLIQCCLIINFYSRQEYQMIIFLHVKLFGMVG